MNLFIVATYVILGGIIVYLLTALSTRGQNRCVEVRDTILAPEELQKHAIEIARNHPVGRSARSLHWLVRRLNDNYSLISSLYKNLNFDAKDEFPTAPASEWLLDNFYIIEEQVKLIRKNLLRGSYSRLPVLRKGYLRGYPRVYAIALEIVAHSDGRIDEKALTDFIQAYQSQALLSMGELWAVPLMLRIALVESIRNICDKVSLSRDEWHRAERLVQTIASGEADEHRIGALVGEQLDVMKDGISPPFVEHLVRKLRKQGTGLSTVTALLDQRLREEHSSTEEITGLEHQLQASMQVSIGNSITGLRLISDLDWNELFESLSKVEQILRKDPCGIYSLMDFESRDHYRHEVEKLARAYGTSEINIADRTVECAAAGSGKPPQDHVGYYLVGRGRRTLLNTLGKTNGKRFRPFLVAAKKPVVLYFGLIALLMLFLVSYLTYYAQAHSSDGSIAVPIAAALLVLVPCSEIAINLVHTVFSRLFRPTMLAKLELKEGVPGEYATFVVMPTLLSEPGRARELLRQLEVFYLANREKNLFFGLIGDFKDASEQEQPSDNDIIQSAVEGIRLLNSRYGKDGSDIFYYFHRRRSFSRTQNRWMGWERKRGAIVEFNRLLRGSSDTDFHVVTGELSSLPPIKYIITLDADTSLPMGAAKRLIGTMAHPLNRAVVDESSGVVTEGHGLLQPRISIGIPGANRSLFTRIFAGQGGIDPYTTAVSDIYQDIFDEGIFTGKGIFEIDVFRSVLENRIPENAILSHDLLEGCLLRAGLVSDIELVDGYPARYNSFSARQHRWVRGDWQLLPWLGRSVRNSEGKKVANRLSGLSKWKIVDNLRRSLLYPSLLLLFLAGIGLLPGEDPVWMGIVILTAALPLVTGLLNSAMSGSLKFGGGRTNSTAITGVKAALYQSLLLFMFIPYQAYLMLDAILRTILRVYITRRNLLEWVTAADVEASTSNSRANYFRKMWLSFPAAIFAVFLSLTSTRNSLPVAFPAAVLWVLAPFAAYFVSRPYTKKQYRLTEEDTALLRRTARKTWSFFEDFADAGENSLPPDNFQQDPPKGAAHRTSPTNIGLLLVSALSARDLGYIGIAELVEKIGNTVATMEKLEKWRGHLYNWYNTITLDTLRPLYVSTVDSGNLVGYMMTVKKGLEEYLDKPVLSPTMAQGLLDTLSLECDEAGAPVNRDLSDFLTQLAAGSEMDPLKWAEALRRIRDQLGGRSGEAPGSGRWTVRLHAMTGRFSQELDLFYPAVTEPEAELLIYRSAQNDQENIAAGLKEELLKPGSPKELAARCRKLAGLLSNTLAEKNGEENNEPFLTQLVQRFESSAEQAEGLVRNCTDLIGRLGMLADETDFTPLFDHKRMLFSIGFNAEDGHLSKSYYDLLASESRQASYIAIARGEVDRRHWARLGRKLTVAEGGKGLVSWTGTMFEYLMPLLIMRNYENTIFDETYMFVIRMQKKYGKQRQIPWGISESGYSAFDMNLNYQYKAFGVPELGLKRGLANDMVISPYSVLLALNIEPAAVVENLKELSRMGAEGGYGYYEAVDYTPSRLEKNVQYRIVKSYMAHHQGMSLAALNNYLNTNILQERFHAVPVIQSAELLLQEKSPEKVQYAKEYRDESITNARRAEQGDGAAVRIFSRPELLLPNMHILSNGSYSVMITDGGAGYSRNGDTAITRWSPDFTRRDGFYIFVQNINSNTVWSSTYEPFRDEPEKYKVVFSPDKAEFTRRDGNLETYTEITVSPEDDAEIRRVSITNHSNHTRVVELTSYFEAVLAPPREDSAHPAFSKLFVRTEFVREYECLLASRRQRKHGQRPQWLLHTLALTEGAALGEMQYETDRMRFIGRNRDISDPAALEPDRPLGNSEGSVLDPVMCLRRRVRIEPGQTAKAVFTVAVAQTRKNALEIAEKYSSYSTSERVFEMSWTRSQVEARYLGLDANEAEFYLELVPLLIYRNPLRRKETEWIVGNTCTQQDLWPFGISGDLPVILVEINSADDLDTVQWVLKGHEYWRMKGLLIDLILLIQKSEGYSQPIQDQIRNLIAASHARELLDKNGGVYIRNASQMETRQVTLFYTVARLVIRDGVEALKSSVRQLRSPDRALEKKAPAAGMRDREPSSEQHLPVERKLLFYNGLGGFSEDGSEYVIQLTGMQNTPLPWSNVIANPGFGFLITESGGGYTWALNSREFKLTPWSNDPVCDRQGEIFYMCDLDEGRRWSLTPKPSGDSEPYTVRHGHGYTVFEHYSNGIHQRLTMFAIQDQPVKVCLVQLANRTDRQRKLSVTYYTRPVLGVEDESTSPYIVTRPGKNGVLYVENKYTREFNGKIVFIASSAEDQSMTGDRTSFFGTGGAAEPLAFAAEDLPAITGAGLDPCAAVCSRFSLEPEEERTIVFLLGCANSEEAAGNISERLKNPMTALNELERVKLGWTQKLRAIQVHTPDDSMDIMLNSWLLYQTISCRLWARSAYYQAGGAFGFRDQLQDSMAFLNTCPELTRKQILLHSSHQYREGDVQHWWHEETGRGIRTRYSDDLLWLAFVTAEYIEKTGDTGILNERSSFLESHELKEGEDERYEEPVRTEDTASLYEHCVLAIDRSLRTGPHGLPLMGCGDWNDGMNTVGNKGTGESVWMGWFLISILNRFQLVCQLMNDADRKEKYSKAASELLERMEAEAWDGSWYRRAYFDDGTPLGSAQNMECRIDSIPQSWSAISGVARPRRMSEAMDAVIKYLVDGNEGIIKLLAPPFDDGALQPGYIKGYVPGVRENGGQYTHAATWVVLAFARLGIGDRAVELFHMLNPVNHTRTAIEYSRYKCEPYVIAADVYAIYPHTGRGGWTWYTGAAGWLYKVGIEYITGFQKRGDRLYIEPCIPRSWKGYKISYSAGTASFDIEVKNPSGVCSGVVSISMDGKPCSEGYIPLSDDSAQHLVEVVMGEKKEK